MYIFFCSPYPFYLPTIPQYSSTSRWSRTIGFDFFCYLTFSCKIAHSFIIRSGLYLYRQNKSKKRQTKNRISKTISCGYVCMFKIFTISHILKFGESYRERYTVVSKSHHTTRLPSYPMMFIHSLRSLGPPQCLFPPLLQIKE